VTTLLSAGWTARPAAEASLPVQPDRGQARSWAVQELSRREYQQAKPGLVHRFLNWLFGKITSHLGSGAPLRLGLVVAAVIVALVVGFVIWRSGGLGRFGRARKPAAVLPDRPTTAAGHRAAADRHAAAGDWDQAVVERFRAVARGLEEEAVLRPQPGRTAYELARDGGRALPTLATDLSSAARSFDDVSYGHLPAGPDDDEFLRRVDREVVARSGAAVGAGEPA
jgi:hypothetical protein